MSTRRKWKPSREQHRKWQKIFFNNRHIPLSLITTTQARSLLNDSDSMIFVNREPEKEQIKKVIEYIAQLNSSLAVRISGAGGVGKTHFIRYLQHLIKTKTIIRDLDINLENIKFDCCILDAPKSDEVFNFYYIYTQMWEGLGRESFFEEFSILILRKVLQILNQFATIQLDEKLKRLLGDDWRFWKDFNHINIRIKLNNLSIDDFFEFIQILEKNFRQIFFHIQREFAPRNIRTMFANILSLFKILIPDLTESSQAIEAWQLTEIDDSLSYSIKEQKSLSKFQDLLEIYKWLYPNFVWILALDDLDHLNDPKIQDKFFDLMKIFRNSTHNFCIILTATIDQWTYFDDSIKGTDKFKQLEGIFTSDLAYIDMDYLPDDEMLNWLGRIIQNWWANFNIKLPPDGHWYPFSREAMQLFINIDPNDKSPRTVGNRLLNIWRKLRNTFLINGKLYISSELDAWKLLYNEDYTKLNPYIQNLLLGYRIKETYGSFSGAIEGGLVEILQILRRSQEFELLEIVDIRRNREFTDERFKSKSKKRRADVIITLQEPGGVNLVKIEFQVKAGDPMRKITTEEMESSLELLKYNHTDFLVLLSFSDLSSRVKERLEQYEGRYNLTATNLSKEQQAYCILIAYFRKIAERDLTPIEAAHIFLKIFGQSPHIFFRNWLKRKQVISTGIDLEEEAREEPEKEKKWEEIVEPALIWIIKKGLERNDQFKNRVTKTWLLNRRKCPQKKSLNRAWKILVSNEEYGKLIKSSFHINKERARTLINNS